MMDRQVVVREMVRMARELTGSMVTPQVIEKIRRLTDQNYHTESVLLLAKTLGDTKMVSVLNAIVEIQKYAGELPRELGDMRYEMLKKLLAKAKAQMSPEEYEGLHGSF